MGALHYGGDHGYKIAIDDRTLAHLQVVIVNKLRRGECFIFSWNGPESRGIARSTVWVSPSIPLRFEFSSHNAAPINRDWVEMLSLAAMGANGLRILDEPEIVSKSD